MKDITETLTARSNVINLSAGNPVILPEVAALWKRCTRELVSSSSFDEVLCRYGSSQGYEPFIEALVGWFNENYKWDIKKENVVITPGSQMLYFIAANVFGGYTTDNRFRRIVLPLCPEYTGYEGVVLDKRMLKTFKPIIEERSSHEFKYLANIGENLVDENTGAVIFSRPCNPTGNIVSDKEVEIIVSQASSKGVPVFIDSAYAPPFPSMVYDEFENMKPAFGGNIVHCMSMSKAGMPGERVGIAIGAPEYISSIEAFQSNANIHSSRFGQAIAAKAIASGELAEVSKSVIAPYYRAKADCIKKALHREMGDVPWSLHKGEGGIFAWLWLKNLPITDVQLYHDLKAQNLIVVPGSTFFPGFNENWDHKGECIRVSLTATEEAIEEGVRVLARVADAVYNAGSQSKIMKNCKSADCHLALR